MPASSTGVAASRRHSGCPSRRGPRDRRVRRRVRPQVPPRGRVLQQGAADRRHVSWPASEPTKREDRVARVRRRRDDASAGGTPSGRGSRPSSRKTSLSPQSRRTEIGMRGRSTSLSRARSPATRDARRLSTALPTSTVARRSSSCGGSMGANDRAALALRTADAIRLEALKSLRQRARRDRGEESTARRSTTDPRRDVDRQAARLGRGTSNASTRASTSCGLRARRSSTTACARARPPRGRQGSGGVPDCDPLPRPATRPSSPSSTRR